MDGRRIVKFWKCKAWIYGLICFVNYSFNIDEVPDFAGIGALLL